MQEVLNWAEANCITGPALFSLLLTFFPDGLGLSVFFFYLAWLVNAVDDLLNEMICCSALSWLLMVLGAFRVDAVAAASADDDVFQHLAATYANNHLNMHKGFLCNSTQVFPGGITNGAAWYPLTGMWLNIYAKQF